MRSLQSSGAHGVHGVIVAAVLGHASPSFTIAVYQHAWQAGPQEAAAALEKALGSGLSEVGLSDVGNPLAGDHFEPVVERELIAN